MLEQLGFLQITEEALEQITKYKDEMLTALVKQNNRQAGLPKNIVLTQDGLMEIEQNLKTGEGKSDYFSRVTEL